MLPCEAFVNFTYVLRKSIIVIARSIPACCLYAYNELAQRHSMPFIRGGHVDFKSLHMPEFSVDQTGIRIRI